MPVLATLPGQGEGLMDFFRKWISSKVNPPVEGLRSILQAPAPPPCAYQTVLGLTHTGDIAYGATVGFGVDALKSLGHSAANLVQALAPNEVAIPYATD